jgi:hypothetical protein
VTERLEDVSGDELTTVRCGDELMENDWQEGFRCTQPPGHNGPHRDTSDFDSDNVSTSSAGRKYRWVYEWRYEG